jgi:hypothetical protein
MTTCLTLWERTEDEYKGREFTEWMPNTDLLAVLAQGTTEQEERAVTVETTNDDVDLVAETSIVMYSRVH